MLADGRAEARALSDCSTLECQNGGQCVEPAVSNLSTGPVVSSPSSLGSRPSCDCRGTGHVGEVCEVPCTADCKNGGKCVPADESRYGVEGCSCSRAVVDGNPFAGLTCEFGATRSCMALGSESKHSFCTNGGDCRAIVGDNERHSDCVCKEGYEGSHCEYVLGTAPRSSDASGGGVSAAKGGYFQESQPGSGNDGAVFMTIYVVAALIGALLLAFAVRAHRRRSAAKRRERELIEEMEQVSMIPAHNQRGGDNIL